MPTLYQRLIATYRDRDLVDTFLKAVAERNHASASILNQPEIFCGIVEKDGTAEEIAKIENAARVFFASPEVNAYRNIFDLNAIEPTRSKPWWKFW